MPTARQPALPAAGHEVPRGYTGGGYRQKRALRAGTATVWQIASHGDDDAATVHGTQTPVDCMLRPILNNSARGDAVYEPFAGSGSTFIAADKVGRRCFGLEIEPRYCDVVVNRWQTFSSKPATLDGDGRRFENLTSERRPRAA